MSDIDGYTVRHRGGGVWELVSPDGRVIDDDTNPNELDVEASILNSEKDYYLSIVTAQANRIDELENVIVNTMTTDSNTTTGETVGLIDAILTLSSVLVNRDLHAPEIQEALQNLREDENLRDLLNGFAPV